MDRVDDLIARQIEYYRARAGEYDEWFLRRGRYDRGVEANQSFLAEAARLVDVLDEFTPVGRVLELACGTGLFTQHLVRHADAVTGIDSSTEVIELNRRRCADKSVRFVHSDVFDWQPDGLFDVVFFSFWLSHVPLARFEQFWSIVRRSLKPGGRVLFFDSLYNPDSTARDHSLRDPASTVSTRRLNDGREFEICKIFYDPADLQKRMEALGWKARVATTGSYFLYGEAK